MLEIPETFQILTAENGERLVGPSPVTTNYSWKDWKLRWLRSLHLQEDDSIISVGFPKFMNLGEGCNKYHISENDIISRGGSDLFATLKIDGSLLIRFVRDGKVYWRTRGSFGVGLSNADEIDSFCQSNPCLADPTLCTNESLLFEWVTPANKIVITYSEPKLFLIGGVKYKRDTPWYDANPRLFTIKEIKEAAGVIKVEATEIFPLKDSKEVEALIKRLEKDNVIEGFVLRFDQGQRLVKLKAEHYKTLHALRSNLTTAKLIELWLQWDKPKWGEYADRFTAVYDYECWEWALPAVSSMYDGVRVAMDIYTHVQKFVEDNRDLDRKKFALTAQDRFNNLNLALCFTKLDGKEPKNDFWKKIILQNSKKVEIKMFGEQL